MTALSEPAGEGGALRKNAVEQAKRRIAKSRSFLAPVLLYLYRIRVLRPGIRNLCCRLEGGPFFSETLRQILHDFYGAEIGRYSYGPILEPSVVPPGSKVGAYCSIGPGLKIYRRNRALERPSLHPFFFNHKLGFLNHDMVEDNADNPLEIGNDVWMGARVIILPGCRHVGNGAVIAAGAVVARDVPPYTVIGGVPARTLRTRFNSDTITALEKSRWWEYEIDLLIGDARFLRPASPDLSVIDARPARRTIATAGEC